MNENPICWMLIGLPGSGKSTIVSDYPGVILSTDNYIEFVAEHNGMTYSEAFKDHIKDAEKNLNAQLSIALQSNSNIVWDQTNLTKSSRAKKLAKIPSHYRKVAVYVAPPDEEELQRRLNSRPGKIIPEKTLQEMKERLEFPDYSENFDSIIVRRNYESRN